MRRPPCAASTAANRHRRAAEEKAPESRTKLSFEVKDLTLKTTLGTGTFGRVRLAKLNGNCYALKILKKSEVRARASRARAWALQAGALTRHLPPCPTAVRQIIRLKQVDHIKSEVKILSMIQHPFIVNLCVGPPRHRLPLSPPSWRPPRPPACRFGLTCALLWCLCCATNHTTRATQVGPHPVAHSLVHAAGVRARRRALLALAP